MLTAVPPLKWLLLPQKRPRAEPEAGSWSDGSTELAIPGWSMMVLREFAVGAKDRQTDATGRWPQCGPGSALRCWFRPWKEPDGARRDPGRAECLFTDVENLTPQPGDAEPHPPKPGEPALEKSRRRWDGGERRNPAPEPRIILKNLKRTGKAAKKRTVPARGEEEPHRGNGGHQRDAGRLSPLPRRQQRGRLRGAAGSPSGRERRAGSRRKRPSSGHSRLPGGAGTPWGTWWVSGGR